MKPLRLLYLGFGWLCVGLGILGVIMPLFPTTPFLLIAVWAFSKSSPELAEKLRNHPVAGSYIRGWQDHGVIPPAAKTIAVVMMSVMATYVAGFSSMPGWLALLVCAILLAVGIYILTRPSAAPITQLD
jgi:uncharacterized membrane protein YbaN (DUF454 family)